MLQISEANAAKIQERRFRTDNIRTLIDSNMLNMLVVMNDIYLKLSPFIQIYICKKQRKNKRTPKKQIKLQNGH